MSLQRKFKKQKAKEKAKKNELLKKNQIILPIVDPYQKHEQIKEQINNVKNPKILNSKNVLSLNSWIKRKK